MDTDNGIEKNHADCHTSRPIPPIPILGIAISTAYPFVRSFVWSFIHSYPIRYPPSLRKSVPVLSTSHPIHKRLAKAAQQQPPS
jgi:hypothetical protein